MEKLVYLLWRRSEDSSAQFSEHLRGEVVDALHALGAERIRVSVNDGDVAAGEPLRIAPHPPGKAAMVSLWCPKPGGHTAVSDILGASSARTAGYRVHETVPLSHEPVPPGERTPGFSTVTCFAKRPDLSHEAFLAIWHGEHEACAIETQSTFGYVRNEVREAITEHAPHWDAIVEENFPLAALTDDQAFYDAVGDAERTRANAHRMFTTVQRFLDLSTVDRTPCSEYNFD